jgi:hypothetical protein
VQGLARGDEGSLHGRVLDLPGQPAVAAPRQQVFLGLVPINGMEIGAEVFVRPGAETHEDLIPPRPDAVVGGPAAKTAWFVIDHHMLEDNALRRCRWGRR